MIRKEGNGWQEESKGRRRKEESRRRTSFGGRWRARWRIMRARARLFLADGECSLLALASAA